ncbi:MAG: hypothetical protein ABSG17_00660 [Spirochaetia bacterium]
MNEERFNLGYRQAFRSTWLQDEFTRLPNLVIDVLAPCLTSSQHVVLQYLLRQTVGWECETWQGPFTMIAIGVSIHPTTAKECCRFLEEVLGLFLVDHPPMGSRIPLTYTINVPRWKTLEQVAKARRDRKITHALGMGNSDEANYAGLEHAKIRITHALDLLLKDILETEHLGEIQVGRAHRDLQVESGTPEKEVTNG